MKLEAIRLCPFAGLTDIHVEFEPQLTVILGANEAGKSTIFRALDSVLLTRTDLTPARLDSFMELFLPVGGGDTIAVELSFSHVGEPYKLRRQWAKKDCTAQLMLPDGSLMTSEDAVVDRLDDMLGATIGTYRSVLMARQSQLGQTLKTLTEDNLTRRTLDDILRSAVQETDGVSVEAFESQLEEEYEAYYSRWDEARGLPENGRGIQNPWKKQVGLILKAWYERETLRQQWEETEQVEKRIDSLNAQLTSVTAACEELDTYVKQHADAAGAVLERERIAAQEKSLLIDLETLKQANKDWPVQEQALPNLEKRRSEAAQEVERLVKERAQAEKTEASKELLQQYERVQERQAQLETAKNDLDRTPVLNDAHLDEMTKLATSIRELEARLAGGQLRARLAAKAAISLSLKCGAKESQQVDIAAGETHDIEADGAFLIDHEAWSLQVEAGAGGYANAAAELEDKRQAFHDWLQEHNAKDEAEARRLHADYIATHRAFEAATQNLADELGEKDTKTIKAEVEKVNDGEQGARPLAQVVEAHMEAKARLDAANVELKRTQEALEELCQKFESPDKLFEKVVDITAKRKALDEKRDSLPPLPEGVDDPRAFADEYNKKRSELEAQRESENGLQMELASIRLPDQSAEELKMQFDEAEIAFAATERRAQAIAHIREVAAEVQAQAAAIDPYADLKDDLEGYISQMTTERYGSIRMAENLPSGFVRQDGQILGINLLSVGTRDVLGLAMRLAMAGHFLGEHEGFIVMDDPLVDMDPARQAAAAALLKQYAEARQLVVFTCHPAHAAKLSNKPKEL